MKHKYLVLSSIPEEIKYCLVLGAVVRNGKISPIILSRLKMALKIYNDRERSILVLSGDIDDSTAMLKFLKESGCDESRIIVDDMGTNTFMSLKNMHALIGEESFMVLTSTFHMSRTMFIAKALKLNALPVDMTEFESKINRRYMVRENLAKVKACFLILRDKYKNLSKSRKT